MPVRFLTLAIAVASVACVGRAPVPRNSTSACLPDTARYIVGFRKLLIDALTGPTEDDSLFRESAGLPLASAVDIQIVQSESVCQQAAAALATASGTGTARDATWVIRVKTTRYLVFNLNQYSAGRFLGFVFDSKFQHLKSFIL